MLNFCSDQMIINANTYGDCTTIHTDIPADKGRPRVAITPLFVIPITHGIPTGQAKRFCILRNLTISSNPSTPDQGESLFLTVVYLMPHVL